MFPLDRGVPDEFAFVETETADVSFVLLAKDGVPPFRSYAGVDLSSDRCLNTINPTAIKAATATKLKTLKEGFRMLMPYSEENTAVVGGQTVANSSLNVSRPDEPRRYFSQLVSIGAGERLRRSSILKHHPAGEDLQYHRHSWDQ